MLNLFRCHSQSGYPGRLELPLATKRPKQHQQAKPMSNEINIGAFLGTRAHLNPGKEALYDVASDQRFTFTELNGRANQASAALSSLGLVKGDRVALLTYNGHEF